MSSIYQLFHNISQRLTTYIFFHKISEKSWKCPTTHFSVCDFSDILGIKCNWLKYLTFLKKLTFTMRHKMIFIIPKTSSSPIQNCSTTKMIFIISVSVCAVFGFTCFYVRLIPPHNIYRFNF